MKIVLYTIIKMNVLPVDLIISIIKINISVK